MAKKSKKMKQAKRRKPRPVVFVARDLFTLEGDERSGAAGWYIVSTKRPQRIIRAGRTAWSLPEDAAGEGVCPEEFEKFANFTLKPGQGPRRMYGFELVE